MESKKENSHIDVATECLMNTHYQSKKHKEFNDDTEEFYKAFHKYSAKYGNKIAGFYLMRMKNSGWSIGVCTDGEIK